MCRHEMKRVVLATLWLLRKNISRKKQETPLSVPEAAVYCAMFSKTITATTEVLAEHMPFTQKFARFYHFVMTNFKWTDIEKLCGVSKACGTTLSFVR